MHSIHSIAEHMDTWRKLVKASGIGAVTNIGVFGTQAQVATISAFLESGRRRGLIRPGDQFLIDHSLSDWEAVPFLTRLALLSLTGEIYNTVMAGKVDGAEDMVAEVVGALKHDPQNPIRARAAARRRIMARRAPGRLPTATLITSAPPGT
jgi:hypothetical protein